MLIQQAFRWSYFLSYKMQQYASQSLPNHTHKRWKLKVCKKLNSYGKQEADLFTTLNTIVCYRVGKPERVSSKSKSADHIGECGRKSKSDDKGIVSSLVKPSISNGSGKILFCSTAFENPFSNCWKPFSSVMPGGQLATFGWELIDCWNGSVEQFWNGSNNWGYGIVRPCCCGCGEPGGFDIGVKR